MTNPRLTDITAASPRCPAGIFVVVFFFVPPVCTGASERVKQGMSTYERGEGLETQRPAHICPFLPSAVPRRQHAAADFRHRPQYFGGCRRASQSSIFPFQAPGDLENSPAVWRKAGYPLDRLGHMHTRLFLDRMVQVTPFFFFCSQFLLSRIQTTDALK